MNVTGTNETTKPDDPAGRLQTLVRRMVNELREFDDGGDGSLWALSQAAADDLELYLLDAPNEH